MDISVCCHLCTSGHIAIACAFHYYIMILTAYFPFNYLIGATASKMQIFTTDSENGQESKQGTWNEKYSII